MKRPKALRERQKCNKRQAKYLSNQFQCSTVFVSRPPKLNKLTREAAAVGEEEAAVEPRSRPERIFRRFAILYAVFCLRKHTQAHAHTRR